MKTIKDSLAVFLAAMVGGFIRYGISSYFSMENPRIIFPWATLIVNYLGTVLLIVLVKGYLSSHGAPKRFILAMGTGFCGGLTTFSSLLLDTAKLLEKGYYLELVVYLVLSIAGSFLLALLVRKWIK